MTQPRYDRVRSVCPFCSVGCQLAYDAGADRAAGLDGAVNRDGRLCPKGIAAFDGIDPDERLTAPLVREDGDGGDLREATWAEAIERAVEGLRTAADEHGPDALAFLGAPHCTNEENYLFGKIARLLGTNNVDNRARICHAATERAMAERLGSGAMTNTVSDLREADAYLVVGANPAERQPIAFDRAIRPSVNGGATLIVLDPRRSGTSRLADHHLAPRPGTDALVLAALAEVVVEEELVDEAFVAERTTGYDAFVDRLAAVDVDDAAATADVDPDDLRAAARAFGLADGGAAFCGTGLEPPDHEDTAAPDALLNLLLLTGNVGKRGAGMNLLRGLNNEQGANDVGCRPDALPGHVPVTDEAGRARVAEAWGLEPATADGLAEPGRHELDLVSDFGEGVRAAWTFGENPAVTKLDDEAVAAGMDALDTLVVQDVARTETVERADVVLPASAWAEKAGTVTNLDRQVQRMRPAAEPPDGVRRDLTIICDLGRRLTGRPFDYDGPAAVFEELRRVCPPYAGMSYDEIGAGSQRWPFPAGAASGVDVLHRERFESGSKRAAFVPVAVGASDDRVDGADASVSAADLVLVTARGVAEFVGSGTSSATASPRDDALQIHPDDADERGIDDGDAVTVETDRGRIWATARVTTDVRPGTTFGAASLVDPIAGEGHVPVTVRPA